MKLFTFLLIPLQLILTANIAGAQEQRVITLPMLYRAMEAQNPVAGIKLALDSANALQVKNISTAYYPKLDLNAAASWQSEVTSIDLSSANLPFSLDIPSPERDQYRITFDISQIIWDGGFTSARKELAYAQLKAEQGGIASELYNMRDRVNDAFFAILQLDISQQRLRLMSDELTARKESLEGGVRQGIILQSVTKSLQAEILRLKQKQLELASHKASLVNSLGKLTGVKLGLTDRFVMPDLPNNTQSAIRRPELQSLEYQREVLDARSDLTARKRMPTLAGYVSSGYGKPGLNMLSNEWSPFVLAGAKLSWRIWDWSESTRERQQLLIQKSIIDLRQRAFEDGVESALVSADNQLSVLEQQLALDAQVTILLDDVKRKSESQLANGSITSSEYLADFNAAARARLDMENRKVLLIKERVKRYFLLGQDL